MLGAYNLPAGGVSSGSLQRVDSRDTFSALVLHLSDSSALGSNSVTQLPYRRTEIFLCSISNSESSLLVFV